MPTLEATEYERFSFDEADQNALTLDEAIKKAKDLRKNDSANYYRIEWTDDSHTAFMVKKVPVASVYADFVTRVAKLMGRYGFRRAQK